VKTFFLRTDGGPARLRESLKAVREKRAVDGDEESRITEGNGPRARGGGDARFGYDWPPNKETAETEG